MRSGRLVVALLLCSLGAAPLAHADDDALSELAAIRDFRSRWPRSAALAHLKDAALVKLDPTFGVSPDGRRLLMIVFHEAASPWYSRTTCDGEWMVLGVEGPTGKAWCAPLDMGHRYQMPFRWNGDGTRAIATAITNTRLVVALIRPSGPLGAGNDVRGAAGRIAVVFAHRLQGSLPEGLQRPRGRSASVWRQHRGGFPRMVLGLLPARHGDNQRDELGGRLDAGALHVAPGGGRPSRFVSTSAPPGGRG